MLRLVPAACSDVALTRARRARLGRLATLALAAASCAPRRTPAAAVPRWPLALVVRALDDRETDVLALRPDGELSFPLLGGPPATLDRHGCLRGRDGRLWVDASDPRRVWTSYQEYAVDHATSIHVGNGRVQEIQPDGVVRSVAGDGAVEAATYGTIVFRGYRPEAARDARALLVAFMAMMPSMATSDGHPRPLPPPAHSPCTAPAPSPR